MADAKYELEPNEAQELETYRRQARERQQRRWDDEVRRARRAARRRKALAFVWALLTPIGIATLLVIQMCGCHLPPAPVLPPTTQRISIAKLYKPSGSFCTAWKVDDDMIATAGHCCDPETIEYRLEGPYATGSDITVLVDDDVRDICILKAELSGPALKLGARDPELGAFVFTAGYPRGYYLVSLGLWSGRAEWLIKGKTEIGTLASTVSQPGASGSPVMDSSGRVVGLINACPVITDNGTTTTMETVSIMSPIEFLRADIRAARRKL